MDRQSNFTCTKELLKRDWFEQSLMTDFTMFGRKSEKKLFSEERFDLFALYGGLAKSGKFN